MPTPNNNTRKNRLRALVKASNASALPSSTFNNAMSMLANSFQAITLFAPKPRNNKKNRNILPNNTFGNFIAAPAPTLSTKVLPRPPVTSTAFMKKSTPSNTRKNRSNLVNNTFGNFIAAPSLALSTKVLSPPPVTNTAFIKKLTPSNTRKNRNRLLNNTFGNFISASAPGLSVVAQPPLAIRNRFNLRNFRNALGNIQQQTPGSGNLFTGLSLVAPNSTKKQPRSALRRGTPNGPKKILGWANMKGNQLEEVRPLLMGSDNVEARKSIVTGNQLPEPKNELQLRNFSKNLRNIQKLLQEISFNGIKNTGNSCFMNSLMQLLISIPELIHIASVYGSIWPCSRCTYDNPIQNLQCSICGEGKRPELNNINKLYILFNGYINTPINTVFDPTSIFDNSTCPYFLCPVTEGQQPIILNRAESERQKITFQQDPADLFRCIFSIKGISDDASSSNITNSERECSTHIKNLLGHTSYRRQQCIARDTSKMITNTPNPLFDGLYFPLGFTDNFPSDGSGSIKDLLKEVTKIEELTSFNSIPISANERKKTGFTGRAPNNKSKPVKIDGIPCLDGKYTNQIIISDPPISILAVNRINFAGINMRSRIKITTECNIDINITINGSLYILIGFIFHSGGAGGGHYIYYYYDSNSDTLILCNDETITPKIPNKGKPGYVDVSYGGSPASQNAVLLAYRKI